MNQRLNLKYYCHKLNLKSFNHNLFSKNLPLFLHKFSLHRLFRWKLRYWNQQTQNKNILRYQQSNLNPTLRSTHKKYHQLQKFLQISSVTNIFLPTQSNKQQKIQLKLECEKFLSTWFYSNIQYFINLFFFYFITIVFHSFLFKKNTTFIDL